MFNPTIKTPKTKESPWTILKLLQWTTAYFNSRNIEGARSSAEILLAHSLGLKRIDLYLRYDQPLSREELALFKELIKRRAQKEPVAYIIGNKNFWTLELDVTPDVLIPRPDTECLVEQALKLVPGKDSNDLWEILDLGTGSGAVVLSLAAQYPQHLYFASDRSERALKVAKKNAKKHSLSGSILFFAGNWLAPLKNKNLVFDMIVSNPPYIPTRVIEGLEPEISLYEPKIALDGGKDGLDCIRSIICQAPEFIKAGGYLILEIGFDQQKQVIKIVENCGRYISVHVVKDDGGHDRVAIMKTTH